MENIRHSDELLHLSTWKKAIKISSILTSKQDIPKTSPRKFGIRVSSPRRTSSVEGIGKQVQDASATTSSYIRVCQNVSKEIKIGKCSLEINRPVFPSGCFTWYFIFTVIAEDFCPLSHELFKSTRTNIKISNTCFRGTTAGIHIPTYQGIDIKINPSFPDDGEHSSRPKRGYASGLVLYHKNITLK